MDIVAHTLWAAAGATVIHRRRPLTRSTVLVTLVLAALPDVIHLLPIARWWLFADGSFDALWGYAVAVPGQEPDVPSLVGSLSHHLHCVMHSAPIAGIVTLALWWVRRTFWIPLLGWWSHIVIDVFTHSADYYAVPVLYPFTERGFDGIAWITPWFMALNYTGLAALAVWLLMSRKRNQSLAGPRRGVAKPPSGWRQRQSGSEVHPPSVREVGQGQVSASADIRRRIVTGCRQS